MTDDGVQWFCPICGDYGMNPALMSPEEWAAHQEFDAVVAAAWRPTGILGFLDGSNPV